MARPFIEFLQSQRLEWVGDPDKAGRAGLEIKLLSEDNESGATTLLVRYPPNWRAPSTEWCTADEELFVLEGEFSVNSRSYTRHHYAYWPTGFCRSDFTTGTKGATLIACFNARPSYRVESPPPGPADGLVEQLDAFSLRWDRTNMDPNIDHLNAWRKNLRHAPGNGGRTYLLAGLPQGFPPTGNEPLERHPHVEEMFMIAGDMPCSLGVMRAGAYFWRPPMIWHGADCTVNGFLLFARTPGSNQTISEWSDTGHPVTFDPEHRPQLPDSIAFAGEPIDDPIRY